MDNFTVVSRTNVKTDNLKMVGACITVWCLTILMTMVAGADGSKPASAPTPIGYRVYTSYFESNRSGLKGESSY